MISCYSMDVAVKIGINSALIAGYIKQKLREDEQNKWVCISQKQLTAVYPFMSEKAVRNALNRLLRAGILIRRQFNKSNYDQTYSYSFSSYGASITEGIY